MKPNNQKRALFDAVTNIDEDMIAETGTPRLLTFPNNIKRVAAIAAALAILITAVALWPTEENYITGSGVLVVRAYAADTEEFTEENSVVLEEGITLPQKYAFDGSVSFVDNGMSLMFSIPEGSYEGMEITFECILSEGSFELDLMLVCEGLHQEEVSLLLENMAHDNGYLYWSKAYLGDHFTVNNNQRMYWVPYTMIFDHDKQEYKNAGIFSGKQAFVDIIIRADNYIVGYAVIEFYGDANTADQDGHYSRYYARMLKTESFPQVDGKYQKVTREFVEAQFQRIKLASESE